MKWPADSGLRGVDAAVGKGELREVFCAHLTAMALAASDFPDAAVGTAKATPGLPP